MRLRTLRERADLNSPDGAVALEQMLRQYPRGITVLVRKAMIPVRTYAGRIAYRVWELATPSVSPDTVAALISKAIKNGRMHHLRVAVKFLPPIWLRRLRPDDTTLSSLLDDCGQHDNEAALRVLCPHTSLTERVRAWNSMVHGNSVACEQALWDTFAPPTRATALDALLERMTENYFGNVVAVNDCMRNIAERLRHQDLLRALPPDRLSMDGRGQPFLQLCQQRLQVLEDQQALDKAIPKADTAPARIRPRL